jgi:2-desacetyl-2-hydroxyethyl bacteriochlorophyllide A dehydrogenase
LARAVWYVGGGRVELRETALAGRGPGDCLVRTLWSGISRGTERLVFNGEVPASEHARMRGPSMEGDFPFPVKYGYCAVGNVEEGPEAVRGRNVFALHPHQERFVLPAGMLTVLPDDLPPRRATLAANMETALNAVWDSGLVPGDRVAVVGAGVVGLLVANLAARTAGCDVTVVDPAVARQSVAEALGCRFTRPSSADLEADIVFHASATAAGLATALDLAAFEATVVELSWYGKRPVAAPLGGPFHSRRLKLVSSQVGHVSDRKRARWDYARRMAKALQLLADRRLDLLIGEEVPFDDAPGLLPPVFSDAATGLAPVIRYS